MIFTADKERDVIDKLTEENRKLKIQIQELQNDIKTKTENYNLETLVFKEEIKYQTKEKERFFREIQNISNLYNKEIKELKEEIKEKEKLIKAPNIAKEINVEMEELVNNINEKLITIMDMIGEYDDTEGGK